LEVEHEEVASVIITNHRPLRLRFSGHAAAPSLQLEKALGRAYPRSRNSFNSLEAQIPSLALMKVAYFFWYFDTYRTFPS
jgi:hypothetical protein